VRSVVRAVTRHDWHGAEHLPASGGFVVVQNHLSHADPLTLAHFLYDNGHAPYFMAKESLFRLPVLGRWIAATGQIPVHRHSSRAADAARAGVQAVRDGKAVIVFPEGTLTRDPGLWPMTGRTGAARIALETRCPVVPVAQWGAQHILAPYGRRLHLIPPTLVHVRAGAPIDLSDLYAWPVDAATLLEATTRIMGAVTALLEGLRAEPAPPERYDQRLHPGDAA
jgi:1-acyl-sn-glycerol-3-phosphate acyltransferase